MIFLFHFHLILYINCYILYLDLLHIDLFDRGTESHSMLLRDKVSDIICQELVEDRGVPILRGKPATLFLNGEYWYDRYIREKYSNQYFEDYYGIEKGTTSKTKRAF